MIELEHITKTFKVQKREAGTKNAIKTFFNRKYQTIKALDDVSFKISDGEIIGYIGPNGAGKSTTIKIMCGILTPDKGTCMIDGKIPYGNRSSLWWDVPVDDSFELNKAIYKIPDEIYLKQKKMLVDLLDIEDIIKKPTRTLSLGQRMRCEIAISFLHSPKIVFLDEPTIGLDSVSKIAVRNFIKKINKEQHTTIILTTHDTGDIKALAKRIILIGKGKLLMDGPIDDLLKMTSEQGGSLDDTIAKIYNKYNIA